MCYYCEKVEADSDQIVPPSYGRGMDTFFERANKRDYAVDKLGADRSVALGQ